MRSFLASLAVGVALAAAGPPGPATAAPARTACDLWADYEAWSALASRPVAVVRDTTAAARARDPDDFMAHWLLGSALSGADSASGRAMRDSIAARADAPGALTSGRGRRVP